MQPICFVPIQNLELEDSIHTVKLTSMIKIKKSAKNIHNLHKNFLYRNMGQALTNEVFNGIILYSISNNFVNFEDFFNSYKSVLWLIKDNAIDYTFSFAIDDKWKNWRFSFNSSKVSKSDGSYSQTKFNTEELKQAVTLVRELKSKNIFIEVDSLDTYSNSDNQIIYSYDKTINYNNLCRLQIAWRFIILARTQTYLNSKIAFYMMALESIFSNSRQNIKNTVSLRTAKFISNSQEEIQLNLNLLKEAYNIRSTYLHGSSNNTTNLEEFSFKVDDILRRVINLILSNHQDFGYLSEVAYEEWLRINNLS